ncbi:MAG: hydrogenase formation protein HypD [Pseudomonadota bacterium]
MSTGPTLRDASMLREMAQLLATVGQGRRLRFMHICGTHEATVCRYALRELLPPGMEIVAGPGCPVCVCPAQDIAQAISLAEQGAIVASFGDMLRVPAAHHTLADARAKGHDVRVVSSVRDAVLLARKNPRREVVFFAVGFETTACTFAHAALDDPPPNFSLLTAIRTVPAALSYLVARGAAVDGFVLPGHVCTIIGLQPFSSRGDLSSSPMAVAGFEPVQLLHGLLDLVEQVVGGRPGCTNTYPGLVRAEGNAAALRVLEQAFEPSTAVWRGIGVIQNSGLALRPALASVDARRRFALLPASDEEALPTGCICGSVLLGRAQPRDCPLYGQRCAPEHPVGPCMVSHEGSCRICHEHGAGGIRPASEVPA